MTMRTAEKRKMNSWRPDPVIDAMREDIHRAFTIAHEKTKMASDKNKSALRRKENLILQKSRKFISDHNYYYTRKREAWRESLICGGIVKEEDEDGREREGDRTGKWDE